ncbi:unnamed protein product [Brassica rapa subsp. trilocularis]
MVRIYAESCCPDEAIDVFREIQARGMRPDTVTVMSLLPVCSHLKNAYSVFHSDGHRDLVMFTAVVAGCAVHGMGKEALMIYSLMMDLGIKPDHVFITTLLTACCHAGLIQYGLQIFDSIRTVYCMKPTMER